jgi:hypothetical protein
VEVRSECSVGKVVIVEVRRIEEIMGDGGERERGGRGRQYE